MSYKKDNIIQAKSFQFARSIVELYRHHHKGEAKILLAQLLRSGTSIGANVEEAIAAQSKKDFLAKIYVSCKEARETRYWLRLLNESKLITGVEDYLKDIEHIINILTKITKTTKNRLSDKDMK